MRKSIIFQALILSLSTLKKPKKPDTTPVTDFGHSKVLYTKAGTEYLMSFNGPE